jgi:hypothetical protein
LMATFQQTLDEFMQLDFSSKEMLLDILNKRMAEERRKKIAANAKKAKTELKKGEITPSSASDIIDELESL